MTGTGLNGVVDEVFDQGSVLTDAARQNGDDWLRQMIRIREFESVLDGLAMKGLIPGGVHTAIGQEAVAVGLCAALSPADVLACGHRAHHHSIAKGAKLNPAMAELFGKATGVSGGRGGTMHMAEMGVGLIGGNGIVGASVGIAVGSALAAKMLDESRIAVGIFGDGGANTGRVWESVNLAALWKIPVIIVCENNQYAVQTPTRSATAGDTIAERAVAFGVPAWRVNGQDVVAVHEAVHRAREHALEGCGPTFIEAVTYRYLGHNTGEDTSYRPEAELEEWRELRDPIKLMAALLIEDGIVNSDEIEQILEEERANVEQAIEFATSSPFPEPSDAFGFVAGVNSTPPSPDGEEM